MSGEVITRTCPSCKEEVTGAAYDIGSGPELNCGYCDACFGAEGQRLDPSDPMKSFTTREELLGLLREWFAWWEKSDEAPTSMPEALHVRTAVTLQLADLLEERSRE